MTDTISSPSSALWANHLKGWCIFWNWPLSGLQGVEVCAGLLQSVPMGAAECVQGYRVIKYFLKFLKNIFMLTKIFEETLPWLVKILKTDQQWRSLWTSIPISMDLLRPQCNTRRPQCNTRHPQCNVCMSKCQQRWTLECWAALTTTTALLAFIIMPELSNVLLVNVDFIKTILSCRCYNACTFHVNKTMYGAKLSLYYHYRNSSDGS